MFKFARQFVFVFSGTILRFPIWGFLWVLGKFGLIKIIFQVYPTDEIEVQEFCPNVKILRDFFSARPTLGGIIMDGVKPIGIYVVVPNTALGLAKRENAQLAHSTVRNLLWLHRFTGANSIGLAGQLGFIFEKRHRIKVEKPMFNSLYGAIFSLSETIYSVIENYNIPKERVIIGILGSDIIGKSLHRFLESKGYYVVPIGIKLLKSGKIKIRSEKDTIQLLQTVNVLVNITPTGEHFFQTNCHKYISQNCIIVDFSRPGIPHVIPNKVHTGNRVLRKGMNFVLSLPGDWKKHDIPACSVASILATIQEPTWTNADEFCQIAKQNNFFTSIEDPC